MDASIGGQLKPMHIEYSQTHLNEQHGKKTRDIH